MEQAHEYRSWRRRRSLRPTRSLEVVITNSRTKSHALPNNLPIVAFTRSRLRTRCSLTGVTTFGAGGFGGRRPAIRCGPPVPLSEGQTLVAALAFFPLWLSCTARCFAAASIGPRTLRTRVALKAVRYSAEVSSGSVVPGTTIGARGLAASATHAGSTVNAACAARCIAAGSIADSTEFGLAEVDLLTPTSTSVVGESGDSVTNRYSAQGTAIRFSVSWKSARGAMLRLACERARRDVLAGEWTRAELRFNSEHSATPRALRMVSRRRMAWRASLICRFIIKWESSARLCGTRYRTCRRRHMARYLLE